MTVAGSSSFYLPPQEKEVKFVAKNGDTVEVQEHHPPFLNGSFSGILVNA
jgi:hypothetical protein